MHSDVYIGTFLLWFLASDERSGAGLYSCGDSREATFNDFKVWDMGIQGS
jgi:hypothetical protein